MDMLTFNLSVFLGFTLKRHFCRKIAFFFDFVKKYTIYVKHRVFFTKLLFDHRKKLRSCKYAWSEL